VVGGWDDKAVRYIDISSNTVIGIAGVNHRPVGITQVLNATR
jgi:hypothetical protein